MCVSTKLYLMQRNTIFMVIEKLTLPIPLKGYYRY